MYTMLICHYGVIALNQLKQLNEMGVIKTVDYWMKGPEIESQLYQKKKKRM